MINILKVILIGLLLFSLVKCATNVLASPVRVKKELIKNKYQETIHTDREYDPEIRLIFEDGGMCSGVVIDDHYALSAAHCALSNGMLRNDDIIIVNKRNEATGVYAKFVASDTTRDVALVNGNFSKFNNRRVAFDPRTPPTEPIMMCGYPGNSDFFCSTGVIIGNYYFQYRARAYPIFKGMSGGGVYNPKGEVIGVNSRVIEDSVIVGPVIGVDAEWGI